jgi:large subunit ribosomal protein L30e
MAADQEIREAIKEKRIVIGTRSVMKGVKGGGVKNVFFASNCPESTKKDLEYYASGSFVTLMEFSGNSLQLGELCGKPFNILLVGIKKAA